MAPHPALLHYFQISWEATETVGSFRLDRPGFVLCVSLTSYVTLGRNLSSLNLVVFYL